MAANASFGPWDPLSRVALVCGGGPAGLLTASVLAKHGYKVHVFEKRQDGSKARPGQSYRIVLTQRGNGALKLANLDLLTANVGLKTLGAMIHGRRGTTEILYNSDIDCVGVDRNDLMTALLARVQSDGGPELYFESSYVGLSQDKNVVEFCGALPGPQGPWALLVAADGQHSVVRSDLHKHHGFACSRQLSDKEYIQISAPSQKLEDLGLDSRYVHGFSNNPSNAQLILSARVGCTVGGVMVLNQEGQSSFKAIREMNDVDLLNFFEAAFTKEGAQILEQAYKGKFRDYLMGAQVYPGGATMFCDRFDGADGRVLVLGDAAHAMPATIGQGCNTALEDVVLLDALLEEGVPCTELAAQFTLRRREDVQAVQEMSITAFPTTRLGFLGFVLQSVLVQKLYKAFPKHFPQPSRLLIATDASYTSVLQRKRFETQCFTACCSTAFAGLAALCAPMVAAKGAAFVSCFAFVRAANQARRSRL